MVGDEQCEEVPDGLRGLLSRKVIDVLERRGVEGRVYSFVHQVPDRDVLGFEVLRNDPFLLDLEEEFLDLERVVIMIPFCPPQAEELLVGNTLPDPFYFGPFHATEEALLEESPAFGKVPGRLGPTVTERALDARKLSSLL